jgi:hypothetical protein
MYDRLASGGQVGAYGKRHTYRAYCVQRSYMILHDFVRGSSCSSIGHPHHMRYEPCFPTIPWPFYVLIQPDAGRALLRLSALLLLGCST